MKTPALIFFRHGNTFEANQSPVWVGARTDMPLTKEGERQAEAAAAYIEQNVTSILEITAGPLQRASRFAEMIAGKMRQNSAQDDRLREIDYGLWEGLSSATIRERFGSETYDKWEKEGLWPENMAWQPPRDELNEKLANFLREKNRQLAMTESEHASIIAVTSNGILRLIYTLITNKPCGIEAKVKTGHMCVLAPEGNGWRVTKWNAPPAKTEPRTP